MALGWPQANHVGGRRRLATGDVRTRWGYPGLVGISLHGADRRAAWSNRTGTRCRVEWGWWYGRTWPESAPATSRGGGVVRDIIGIALGSTKPRATTCVRTAEAFHVVWRWHWTKWSPETRPRTSFGGSVLGTSMETMLGGTGRLGRGLIGLLRAPGARCCAQASTTEAMATAVKRPAAVSSWQWRRRSYGARGA